MQLIFDGGYGLIESAEDIAIDLLTKSGISNYVDFTSIEVNSIFDDDVGELWNFPDSRLAIFKVRRLTLMEKNKLMRFFKLVWQHLEAPDRGDGDQGSEENSRSSKILDEDLQSPFVDFQNRMQLPHKIKS
ncbi:hypothetical protein ACFX2I_023709 [Malus domestica]